MQDLIGHKSMSKCILLKYYNTWNALVNTEKGMYSVLLEDRHADSVMHWVTIKQTELHFVLIIPTSCRVRTIWLIVFLNRS